MAQSAMRPNIVKSPLYRYFNGTEHFYTTNAGEIGTTTCGLKGKHGYTSEGIACHISPNKLNGFLPFYRYWNGKEHFYTTNAFEIGTDVYGVTGKWGYKCEGIAGYTPPNNNNNTDIVPLYRYWNGKEHFYTTNAAEIGTTTPGLKGKYGHICEGIACYVFIR